MHQTSEPLSVWSGAVGHDPVELLRQLIRFDTTNPPGNEAQCIGWVKDLCDGAGLQSESLGQGRGTAESAGATARSGRRATAPAPGSR